MSRPFEPADPRGVVSLVNEFASVPRSVAGESTDPYPVAALLPWSVQEAAACTTAGLVDVADRLYAVFVAPSSAEQAVMVNSLLAGVPTTPQLDPDDVSGGLQWLVPDDPHRSLLARSALAILLRLDAGRTLGLCAASRCADAYIDTGRGVPRRYCSHTCQNRQKVRDFRTRGAHH